MAGEPCSMWEGHTRAFWVAAQTAVKPLWVSMAPLGLPAGDTPHHSTPHLLTAGVEGGGADLWCRWCSKWWRHPRVRPAGGPEGGPDPVAAGQTDRQTDGQ